MAYTGRSPSGTPRYVERTCFHHRNVREDRRPHATRPLGGESSVVRSRPVSTSKRENYRTFVGGADYDLKGAMQFSLLYSLGLRAEHRLLDIGCGSLRAGRFFLVYLDPGGYTGLEPNAWLIDEAVEHEIGRDVLAIKRPVFVYNDRFDVSGLGVFDFVVANSIASHTGPAMTKLLFESVRAALSPTGLAAISFKHHAKKDNQREGWLYAPHRPGVARYTKKTIDRWLRDCGLKGMPIPWYHPTQTWWLIARPETSLPSRRFLVQARGVTLAEQESWDAGAQVQKWGQRTKRRTRRRLRRTRRRLGRVRRRLVE
jgi:Methyltransferase domain